jgi:hypothetical protein
LWGKAGGEGRREGEFCGYADNFRMRCDSGAIRFPIK